MIKFKRNHGFRKKLCVLCQFVNSQSHPMVKFKRNQGVRKKANSIRIAEISVFFVTNDYI